MSARESDNSQQPAQQGLLARWNAIPLYLRILYVCIVGAVLGLGLRELDGYVQRVDKAAAALQAATGNSQAAARPLGFYVRPLAWADWLAIPSRLVLQLLTALAAPLVLVAVVQALVQTQIPAGHGRRLIFLLLLNTTVAIIIGLAVANLVQPGKHATLVLPDEATPTELKTDPLQQLLDNVPRSLLGPFTDNGKITSVILIAIAVGIALRRLPAERVHVISGLIAASFDVLLIILHWVIELIPLAVFGIVTRIVAKQGFELFMSLAFFVFSVLLGLTLHLIFYLTRIRFGSWCRPLPVLSGMRDALVMAFSTASSTATMPVTYACLREKVGLREQSASLGALVGANFNNDGTALYQAMAAIFVAQVSGHHLTITDQLLVVLTAIAASVGAAGIPEAGIVTMTLIFKAIGLRLEYIPILLTVDWFLDRCRTAVNVMGDVNVSCLLDGYTREAHAPTTQDRELADIA
jgi:Na+/H+-dicarboxylate symporter